MSSSLVKIISIGTFVAVIFVVLGCQSKPIEELSLADLAVKAAQKAKADSLAADLFRKAENSYLRAKKDFRDGYFDSCRQYANEARLAAEKAEYQALLRQTQLQDKHADDQPMVPRRYPIDEKPSYDDGE